MLHKSCEVNTQYISACLRHIKTPVIKKAVLQGEVKFDGKSGNHSAEQTFLKYKESTPADHN